MSTLLNDVVDKVSTKQATHFGQLIKNSNFQMFDYGTANNVSYGKVYPPSYNLSEITAPITIFYGTKDAMVNPIVSFMNTFTVRRMLLLNIFRTPSFYSQS